MTKYEECRMRNDVFPDQKYIIHHSSYTIHCSVTRAKRGAAV